MTRGAPFGRTRKVDVRAPGTGFDARPATTTDEVTDHG